ncbi:hypothetical protein [Gloeobacter morelensis]|uniref:Uncharacterized protein n=1 Tax=Gloeobacter morelensis MG652769 TaxID=2781736 RepID=A0ABY3PLA0_9CYAN|nr:hypothetical protein [Gloeobacter morelensis]UFP94470.1 hypothetical protein ISF26_22465 [Gloeobacter morelensis MG652769]
MEGKITAEEFREAENKYMANYRSGVMALAGLGNRLARMLGRAGSGTRAAT